MSQAHDAMPPQSYDVLTLTNSNNNSKLKYPLKLTVIVTDPSRPELFEIEVEEKDDFRKIFDYIACQWRMCSTLLDSTALYSKYYFEYVNYQLTNEYVYEKNWDQKFTDVCRYASDAFPELNVIQLHTTHRESSRQRTIDKLVGIPVQTLVGRPVSREVEHFIHSLKEYCSTNLPRYGDEGNEVDQVMREHPPDLLDDYPQEFEEAKVVFMLWIPFGRGSGPADMPRVDGVSSAFTVTGSANARETLQQALQVYSNKTQSQIPLRPEYWVLKVVGRRQYLLGEKPVVAYAWLYECSSPSILLNRLKKHCATENKPFEPSLVSIEGPTLTLVPWADVVDEVLGSRIYSTPDELRSITSPLLMNDDQQNQPPSPTAPGPEPQSGNRADLNSLFCLGLPCTTCVPEDTKRPMTLSVNLPCVEDYQVTITFQHLTRTAASGAKQQALTGTTSGATSGNVMTNSLRLKACIYQAERRLCDPVEGEIHQSMDLRFNLYISQLPRSARLCMVLLAAEDSNKDNKKVKSTQFSPHSWANVCLFDFEYRLVNRRIGVIFWPYEASELHRDSKHDYFRPLGSVVSNPRAEFGSFKLDFMPCIMSSDKRILYPSFRQLIMLAIESNSSPNSSSVATPAITPADKERIMQILSQSLLRKGDLDDNLLWRHRVYVMHLDHNALPKIVDSVDWCDQVQVSNLYILLKGWPLEDTSVATALELLDCKFTDETVRHFAVSVLNKQLTARGASLYLPQLVQALKYENYLDSYLATFLLSQAIQNREFGQMLFYYLRCEMNIPSVSVRFGLLLDAYLRTCPGRMASLEQQLNAAMSMGRLSNKVHDWLREAGFSGGGKTPTPVKVKEDCLAKMHAELLRSANLVQLSHLTSPLHPDICLNDLVVESCKFFDSKKIPLRLSWRAEDAQAFCNAGSEVGVMNSLIYKCGDDLRQDILTLQIFNVMQELWQTRGLPLRLRPYRVVALTSSEGFIELVPASVTLSTIRKNDKTKECVYNWLLEHSRKSTATHLASVPQSATSANQQNGNDQSRQTRTLSTLYTRRFPPNTLGRSSVAGSNSSLASVAEQSPSPIGSNISNHPIASPGKQRSNQLPDEVVERFTQSLAAYTVACFVLGVGDRHTDNIMVAHDGTFFHIDFGNFLGNFKKFAGISREPARFLLVPEFLYVITYGDTKGQKTDEFRSLCEEGYLALRQHANLLITMFLLMANTGLPQLTSPETLTYLEESLYLHGNEEKAREYFRKEWDNSLGCNFRIKFDWIVHEKRRC